MNDTSLSLLARIHQSGRPDAWQELVDLYTPLMRKWLRAYEVNEADAEDLVQEVLGVLVQELPKFTHNQHMGAFRNWLRKILMHRLQNYWRGWRQELLANGSSSLLEQLAQLQDESSQLSRIWNEQHDRDVMARVSEVVRPRFQPKTWEAFRRQLFESQRPAQVAADLGMPVGSVYMARNRVFAALRSEVWDWSTGRLLESAATPS